MNHVDVKLQLVQHPDCPFCQIVAGQAPATTKAEYEHSIVIVPIDPVTDGHVLVVPREHASSAASRPRLTGVTFREAARYVQASGIQANLITSIGPAATQTVRHLHIHIVPRAEGDGLKLPWTDQVRPEPPADPGMPTTYSVQPSSGRWWRR